MRVKRKVKIHNNIPLTLNNTFAGTNRLHKQIEKNLIYPKILFVSLLLIALSILSTFLLTQYLPPEIPLFFGLPESEDQIASSSALIVPSLFSLAILVLNSTIAYFSNDKFIKMVLIFSSLAISLLSTIATLKITLLIGSF
ncbi:hypothetical protein IPM62_00210 [Candidatus Woesebacteria bacterium]|nr:MAG: hypothetical protein IPM62_00210 [Candidatus Woesebacteria bacterium]